MFTISVSHLLQHGVRLQCTEALAVAQQLLATRGGVPAVDNIELDSDGCARCVNRSGTPTVADFAALLQVLLPQGADVPAPLRYTLARGLAAVEAPPFASLDAFSESLARFEAGDRHGIVRALLQRVARAPRLVTPPPASVRSQPAVVAVSTPAPRPQPATPRPVITSAGALTTSQHTPHWRTALIAIAASFMVGALLAGAARLMNNEPGGADARPQTAETSRDSQSTADAASRARTAQRPVATSGATVTPPVADTVSTASATAAPLQPSISSRERPAVPESASQPAAASTEDPRSDSQPDGASASPLEPNVEAVVSGASHPAYSPAFGANGTAMFFHTGGARDASSALAMAPSGAWPADDLRIVKVLDDGARNYHPQPSPDGRLIAFDSDRDGARGIYLANGDGTAVRRISGEGYAAAPTWSPDGTRLAYIRAEASNPRVWNLWVQPLGEQRATRVTNYGFGQTWTASWFPDNRRVCYTHEDKVVVRDLSTGESRQFSTPVAGRTVRTPAVSPDGGKVVFQVFRNGAWLLDLADGSMRRILSDPTAEEFAWAPDGRRIAFHSRRAGGWSIHMIGSN